MQKTAILPIAIIVLLVLLSQSFFTVDEREYALVLQLGEHKQTVDQPGLHFKLPFIQNTIHVDRRLQTSDVDAEELLTVDMERLLIDHVTRWYVNDPLLFYMTVRDKQEALARIQNIVVAELRDVVSNQPILNVIADKREIIMDRVTERASERMQDFGIQVQDVRMKRVDFPPEVEDNVFARMEAERERIAARHRAEGEEIGMEIRAQADADKERILGEAEALATQTFAEGFTEDVLIIRDQEGHAVPGAHVSVNNREVGVTDATGRMTVAFPKTDRLEVKATVQVEDRMKRGQIQGVLEDGKNLLKLEHSGDLVLQFAGEPATYRGHTADAEFFRFQKSLSAYENFMLPGDTTLILGSDSELFDYMRGPGSPTPDPETPTLDLE